jgi:uncharacterized protein YeaC (DUF1315 family)
MSNTPDSVAELVNSITPEIHQQMRTAIELGRWANGDKLSIAQRENTLQLVIAWEAQNLPEEERVGFIDRTDLRKTLCDD